MFIIKQPDSVGASVRSSKVCNAAQSFTVRTSQREVGWQSRSCYRRASVFDELQHQYHTVCSQGPWKTCQIHLCLRGECNTLQKGFMLGTCEVRPETEHTGSLTSSSSVLAYTVSGFGGRTKGSTNVERGLHPTFLNQTKLVKVTNNHQLLCTSPQERLHVRAFASADKQKCSRVGQK